MIKVSVYGTFVTRILAHNNFIGHVTYMPYTIRESRKVLVATLNPPCKLGMVTSACYPITWRLRREEQDVRAYLATRQIDASRVR